MLYGILVWLAILIAPTQPESQSLYVGTQCLKYAFLLLIGVAPLALILRRDHRRMMEVRNASRQYEGDCHLCRRRLRADGSFCPEPMR